MTPGQRNILRALIGRKKPIYGTALFANLNKNKPMPVGTYGAYLGDLITKRYIKAERCKKKGKNKLYTITRAGAEKLRK